MVRVKIHSSMAEACTPQGANVGALTYMHFVKLKAKQYADAHISKLPA